MVAAAHVVSMGGAASLRLAQVGSISTSSKVGLVDEDCRNWHCHVDWKM